MSAEPLFQSPATENLHEEYLAYFPAKEFLVAIGGDDKEHADNLIIGLVDPCDKRIAIFLESREQLDEFLQAIHAFADELWPPGV